MSEDLMKPMAENEDIYTWLLKHFDRTFASSLSRRLLADHYIDRSVVALNQNKPRDALSFAQSALQIEPNHREAFEVLKHIAQSTSDIDTIHRVHNLLTKLRPDDQILDFDRAVAYTKMGDFEQARTLLEYILQHEPHSAHAYYNVAQIRYQMKDLDGARSCYDRTIELQPDFVQAYFNRGRLRFEQRDWTGAIQDLSYVIEHSTFDQISLSLRGHAQFQLRQYSDALTDLNRVLAIYPDDITARRFRCYVFLEIGDIRHAQEDAEVIHKAEKVSADDLMLIAAVKDKSGDSAGALKMINNTLALYPDKAVAFYNRACIATRSGDIENSFHDLERAITLDHSFAALAREDPDLAILKEDPRFHDLVSIHRT